MQKNNRSPTSNARRPTQSRRGVLTPRQDTPRSGLTPYAMPVCRPTLRRLAPSLRAHVCYDSHAGASLSRRRAQPEDGTPLPMLFRPHGARIYFAYFPGFLRWRGSTPGLFYGAPNWRAQKFGSLTLAGSPPQLPICEDTRVFRDSQFEVVRLQRKQ